ncbi:MAG: alpha/beta hydrolase [Pseudomonadota bacterium]
MVTQRLLVLVLVLCVAACSGPRKLVDAPTQFVAEGYPEEQVPVPQRQASAKLLYATDRLPVRGYFGSDRSNALVFGTIDVAFGEDASWDELVAASETWDRDRKFPIEIRTFDEVGRFRDTPLPFAVENGKPVELPMPKAVYQKSERQFQEMVAERVKAAPEKDVIIFIHGFNNTFEDSALSMAEIWHFMGRQGVPLLYTWPAGRGGLVGYFTDRESGEFTIFHLKETLRLVASSPGVERIHIVAHSRGTDVVTTALRELVLTTRAAGRDPRTELKVHNLVLAAPDLDFGVAGQRLIAERFAPAFGRLTVYTNNSDGALGVSQFLMEGLRLGRLRPNEISGDEQRIFERVRNVNFVNVPQARGFFGHSYFRDTPGTLSDLASVIREDADPGSRERPLTWLGGNFWEIPDDYHATRSVSPARSPDT